MKIMVELLSILAQAKKQIKQGRFSKPHFTVSTDFDTKHTSEQFAKKFLGDSEIESILRRLDRLTQDEARMMEAQILEVVHGLMNNMKVVMDGERIPLVDFETSDSGIVCEGGEASTREIRKTLGTFNPFG